MPQSPSQTTKPRRLLARTPISLLVVVPAALLLVANATTAQAAATAVPLGTAGSFVVLAGAGVTNTGPTTLNGDIGTFPTTSITGTGSMTINGVNRGGGAVTQGAKPDLLTAYNIAAGEGPTSPITTDLGGQSLTAGVYKSTSSIGLTGALTLDAAGDPNAVFVFQAASTLTTASASSVVLTNGAQACNVFWQIGSSATLGTGSSFRGTILASASITATTGVTIQGRLLAQNGAVTLDTNTISRPSCIRSPTSPPTSQPGTADPTSNPSLTPSTSWTDTPATGTPTSGTPTSGTSEGLSPGPPTEQITTTPGGPVDSGDDSNSSGSAREPRQLLTAALTFGAVGAIAVLANRRRPGKHVA
ncbi:MAG TPA: ice-binding family protein [Nocardioidaceae bacterium]|nr:ice-binding family protein [Nocardioidaceae bacterium]